MPRFGLDTGFPASKPLAPLHAAPVARAIGPGANRNRLRWVQLGWPQILRLLTTTPLPTPHPKMACHPSPEGNRSPVARGPRACPVVSPHRSPAAGFPVPVERSSRSPSPTSPEGGRRPGLTRRPPRSPATFADSPLLPSSRRSPTARSEVAVNTVRAPIPLSPRETVWAGPKPPSSPLRRRALSGTSISQYRASPQVKRYFRIHRVIPETFSLPPGFLPSSTRCPPFMHNDVHSSTSFWSS
jgi:hypothetical protein